MYFCGREYKRIETKKHLPTILLVIDANNGAIGRTDGERVEVIWEDESTVGRKHNKGGQSKNRFQRGREEALKQWLRKVVDVLKREHGGEDILLGGCGMTKDIFIKELPEYLRERITDVRSVGYTDENGLFELVRISRYT